MLMNISRVTTRERERCTNNGLQKAFISQQRFQLIVVNVCCGTHGREDLKQQKDSIANMIQMLRLYVSVLSALREEKEFV